MKYSIIIQNPAIKQLDRLSTDVQRRIRAKINELADNPRPPGYTKLAGNEKLYRIRIGDYRVIYSIEDDKLIVLIVKVGHRGGVYE